MAQINVTELLPQVAQRVRECPTTTLTRNYVMAVREFCNESRWLQLKVNTISTVVDQEQYAIDAGADLEAIGVTSIKLQHSGTEWVNLTDAEGSTWDVNDGHEEPDQFIYVPHGKFELHSKPDLVYPLRLVVPVQPKRGAISIPEELVVDFEDALIAGALFRLLRIPNMPWTDKGESNDQYTIFRTGIAHANAALLRGYNAGATVTDRLGGGNGFPHGRIQPI